jgi:shikimate kinase
VAAVGVLIGPPGAGKSRIGRRVAKELGVPFVDTDSRIVAAHGEISALFAEHGEEHFRALERAEVERALAEDALIAFGGGAVLDERTQHDLAAVPVVLLTVTADAVAARIGGTSRPLLAQGGVDAWSELYERRRPLYERLADHTVDTSARPMQTIAKEIAQWLRTR